MIIHSVTFVKSSQKWQECPAPILPEYAFIGRSNVGKSSLINAMMNKKDLAKTSQTPGKTQLINHFLINENWFLTDLPGYGYAKVSKSTRKDFEKLITKYILHRKNLVNLFVLIDIRHKPQKIDMEFMEWCAENEIPFSIIFTKTDKIKENTVPQKANAYIESMLESWQEAPSFFLTSAEKKTGTDSVLGFIKDTNQMLEENKILFEE